MPYNDVQDALLTIVREVKGFTARNTSIADPKILGRGIQQAAIISYGGNARDELVASPNRFAFPWVLLVNLWFQGDGDYKEYNAAIGTVVQDMKIRILGYPRLKGTDGVTQVITGDVSAPRQFVGTANRNWWVVSLPVQVTEKTTVPKLES